MKKNFDQLIEEALSTEPAFKLGSDFKDRVVKLIRRKERKAQQKLYVLIALGTLLIFGAGFAVVMLFADLEMLSSLGQLTPLAAVIGGLVVLIQYLDKKLVKDRFFKQLA